MTAALLEVPVPPRRLLSDGARRAGLEAGTARVCQRCPWCAALAVLIMGESATKVCAGSLVAECCPCGERFAAELVVRWAQLRMRLDPARAPRDARNAQRAAAEFAAVGGSR